MLKRFSAATAAATAPGKLGFQRPWKPIFGFPGKLTADISKPVRLSQVLAGGSMKWWKKQTGTAQRVYWSTLCRKGGSDFSWDTPPTTFMKIPYCRSFGPELSKEIASGSLTSAPFEPADFRRNEFLFLPRVNIPI
jgi:hypothetical protein